VKRLGSGRKPFFPGAEKDVAIQVRNRRKEGKMVSKSFVIKELRKGAEKENTTLFGKVKLGCDLVEGFLRRNGFSLRFPSCIRTDNLDESILICRAFHRDWFVILSDTGAIKYAKALDPHYGRFLLKYRFNGDEVPYRFGRVKSIVSLVGERSTHVTFPPGWEARLATLFLLGNGLGEIVLVVVIFQGKFFNDSAKRKSELEKLRLKYPNIRVLFQKKAWMDSEVLLHILKTVPSRFRCPLIHSY
jgi:hypothetical protein